MRISYAGARCGTPNEPSAEGRDITFQKIDGGGRGRLLEGAGWRRRVDAAAFYSEDPGWWWPPTGAGGKVARWSIRSTVRGRRWPASKVVMLAVLDSPARPPPIPPERRRDGWGRGDRRAASSRGFPSGAVFLAERGRGVVEDAESGRLVAPETGPHRPDVLDHTDPRVRPARPTIER